MFALVLSAAAKEPDKTGFYVAGTILVIWAFALTFYGMRSADWPANMGGQRVVIALSTLLVAGTMVAAVATS